ncbi:MAG: S9 family peptidase, partial [Acidobacteriota bacterium]
MRSTKTILALLFIFSLTLSVGAQRLTYPVTKKMDHADNYFGVKVFDPYRWLENENAPETARWVEEQNKVTFGYLEKISYRSKIKERLEKLYNYPKYTPPARRGDSYFFSKNDGLQNQNVLYIQKGLDGEAEVLLDPNKFSKDGTSRLGTFSPSRDGKYAVYGISQGGSDFQDYYVLDIATRKPLTDTVKLVKVSGAAWHGEGFYYSRFDEPEKGKELSFKNQNHKVYYHKLGTPQSQDELIFEDKANPQRFHRAGTTDDERFLILTISDTSSGKRGNALYFRDLSKGEKTFTSIIAEVGEDDFGIIDNVGDKFLIQTNKNAPNGRVFLYDPKKPDEKNWKEILPE